MQPSEGKQMPFLDMPESPVLLQAEQNVAGSLQELKQQKILGVQNQMLEVLVWTPWAVPHELAGLVSQKMKPLVVLSLWMYLDPLSPSHWSPADYLLSQPGKAAWVVPF